MALSKNCTEPAQGYDLGMSLAQNMKYQLLSNYPKHPIITPTFFISVLKCSGSHLNLDKQLAILKNQDGSI